jgi:hypothetical protein
MNEWISRFSDWIALALLFLLLFKKISIKEVKQCRYKTSQSHTETPDHWELAVFLHEQADQRIFLLQAKLSGLLSLQSVLAGLYSLTSILPDGYPRPILLACLAITILGIMISLQPLSISTARVVNLDQYDRSDVFNKTTQDEFRAAIEDLGCRADFYADCISSAKSLIILSMLLFLIGVIFGVMHH